MKPKTIFLGALAGFAMCAFVFSSLQAQQDQPPPARENRLNLTAEQKTKLEEFRKARREERTAFLDQMRKLRAELRDLMKDPQANEKKIDGLIDEMSRLRAARMKSDLKNSIEMKKIFTPEQLEKMKDFRMRMGPRRGMRPGRRGWRQWRMGPRRDFDWGPGPMNRWFWDW